MFSRSATQRLCALSTVSWDGSRSVAGPGAAPPAIAGVLEKIALPDHHRRGLVVDERCGIIKSQHAIVEELGYIDPGGNSIVVYRYPERKIERRRKGIGWPQAGEVGLSDDRGGREDIRTAQSGRILSTRWLRVSAMYRSVPSNATAYGLHSEVALRRLYMRFRQNQVQDVCRCPTPRSLANPDQ